MFFISSPFHQLLVLFNQLQPGAPPRTQAVRIAVLWQHLEAKPSTGPAVERHPAAPCPPPAASPHLPSGAAQPRKPLGAPKQPPAPERTPSRSPFPSPPSGRTGQRRALPPALPDGLKAPTSPTRRQQPRCPPSRYLESRCRAGSAGGRAGGSARPGWGHGG